MPSYHKSYKKEVINFRKRIPLVNQPDRQVLAQHVFKAAAIMERDGRKAYSRADTAAETHTQPADVIPEFNSDIHDAKGNQAVFILISALRTKVMPPRLIL